MGTGKVLKKPFPWGKLLKELTPLSIEKVNSSLRQLISFEGPEGRKWTSLER